VSKSFLFFGAKKKSKVYQPKVKKGKNVSMGFLSNFRSYIKDFQYTRQTCQPQQSCVKKQGVCDTVALPFTLKSILRQKKNYGKLKYLFHHANI
jgi:hypothetical protein